MLTNKNSARLQSGAISSILAAMTLFVFAGCQPAGPKALLLGERYIRQGEYEKALRPLTRASELIPEHPQVWNHLGLAYHGLDQAPKAAEAYQRALRIDRNFTPARYNLGILYLEQNHLPQAAAELSAYLALETNSVTGYVKLGTALLRMKRPDDAERVLIQALRLDPREAEAHNLLGLAHVQRKRPREAMQAFNHALQVSPTYAPAVLNQAVVAHSYFANRDLALERYRAFLSTQPDHKTAARVQHAVRLIEREIAATQLAQAEAEAEAEAQPATSQASTLTNLATRTETKTNAIESRAANVSTQAVAVVKTNVPSAAITTTNVQVATKQPPKTNAVAAAPEPQPSTNIAVATANTNRPPATPPQEPAEPELPPVTVEVVRVEEPEFKAPRDITETKVAFARPDAARPEPHEPPDSAPLIIPRKDRKPEEEKPGVLSRVNPLRFFRNDDSPGERPAARAQTPPPRPSYPPVVKETNPTPEAPRVMPRYPYRKNTPLIAGNRAQAERYFRLGADAHRQRRYTEAIEHYRQAALLDPTYFEAHYNLGLAAYQTKNLPLALAENELAVTTKPSSTDARYNFALTLREANYPADAANELRTLLADRPDEIRAHFTLANLYAQQLDEPVLARRHYLAVLELSPSHPEAPAIRRWLANNP